MQILIKHDKTNVVIYIDVRHRRDKNAVKTTTGCREQNYSANFECCNKTDIVK